MARVSESMAGHLYAVCDNCELPSQHFIYEKYRLDVDSTVHMAASRLSRNLTENNWSTYVINATTTVDICPNCRLAQENGPDNVQP